MQIQVEKEKFLTPVALTAGVVERRQTLPILSYLLLQANQKEISLIGTDLEVEMVVPVEGKVQDVGEATIPARKLLDICRALPEGVRITLIKQGGKVVVTAGKSRFVLVTLPVVDFPKIEVAGFQQVIAMPSGKLKRILESTAFCMAQQDVRYYLNGLYLEIEEGRIRAVATDGHRMAITNEENNNQLSKPVQVIVPRKAIHEILRFLPSSDELVNIELSMNHLRLQVEGLVITTKLIDGKFPDYTKVIPVEQSKTVVLDQRQFREGLSRVAILANEKYRGVRINLQSGKISVTAQNPEQEEAIEEIETSYSGESLEIGFNVNYLVEATNAIESGEILFGLSDSSSSCTLTAPNKHDTQYIVMPMRL